MVANESLSGWESRTISTVSRQNELRKAYPTWPSLSGLPCSPSFFCWPSLLSVPHPDLVSHVAWSLAFLLVSPSHSFRRRAAAPLDAASEPSASGCRPCRVYEVVPLLSHSHGGQVRRLSLTANLNARVPCRRLASDGTDIPHGSPSCTYRPMGRQDVVRSRRYMAWRRATNLARCCLPMYWARGDMCVHIWDTCKAPCRPITWLNPTASFIAHFAHSPCHMSLSTNLVKLYCLRFSAMQTPIIQRITPLFAASRLPPAPTFPQPADDASTRSRLLCACPVGCKTSIEWQGHDRCGGECP